MTTPCVVLFCGRAVMNGRAYLARPLFEKTDVPLRAALMASRFCQRKASSARHDKERWSEQADIYEEWAMGVLDAIQDEKVAVRLLTMLPSKRGRLMWPRSVIDSATNFELPCKRFVGHKNCQQVLDNYWCGDYPGSDSRIPSDA
eukprot:5869829-Prymnesium_polylepis.2